MWETAFDISILQNPDVIVHCPDEDSAVELMKILADHGVKWIGIGNTPNESNSQWREYKEETCYWIERNLLSYADRDCADKDSEFQHHIRCTFYGIESNVEISDDSFKRIIFV